MEEKVNDVLENIVEGDKILQGIVINESQRINVKILMRKNPYWRRNIEQTPEPYSRSTEAIVGPNRRKFRVRFIFAVGSNTKFAILLNLSLLSVWSFRIWRRSKCFNESGQSSLTRI